MGYPLDGKGVASNLKDCEEVSEVGGALARQPSSQGLPVYPGAAADVKEKPGVALEEGAQVAHEGIDVGLGPLVVGLR
jgi:hypothetical protein